MENQATGASIHTRRGSGTVQYFHIDGVRMSGVGTHGSRRDFRKSKQSEHLAAGDQHPPRIRDYRVYSDDPRLGGGIHFR